MITEQWKLSSDKDEQLRADEAEKSFQKSLRKRHKAEARFKFYGVFSLLLALAFLVIFMVTILKDASPAFRQTEVRLSFTILPEDVRARGLSLETVDKTDTEALNRLLRGANYQQVLLRALREHFPERITATNERAASKQANALYKEILSTGAQYRLRDLMLKDYQATVGKAIELWLPSSGALDSAYQGFVDFSVEESQRAVKDSVRDVMQTLDAQERLRLSLNTTMFTNGDSRTAQDAGVKGAVVGSFYTLLVTLLLSFPIAVAAAVYLEEFAPRNRFTDFLEANINNLAAIPSIVFGILGLAIFIQFFGLPRSTPIVGGLVLTLMTLPTIIISSRAALKSVPPSIRSAALGLGASKMQVIFHHVLPLALPGMLTGTIIGMAQALGETAPLLMIGMVAFIADPANGIFDPSNVMPVQIYLWSDLPDRAFVARTSFAIILLLAFLIFMNALAVFLRKKFERKW